MKKFTIDEIFKICVIILWTVSLILFFLLFRYKIVFYGIYNTERIIIDRVKGIQKPIGLDF